MDYKALGFTLNQTLMAKKMRSFTNEDLKNEWLDSLSLEDLTTLRTLVDVMICEAVDRELEIQQDYSQSNAVIEYFRTYE